MSIKTPRLIRDRCGVYYFRWIVPLSWRLSFGKREIRRSLRTKDAAQAKCLALTLSAHMEALMVDKKFLANPTLADFPHLMGKSPNVNKKIRIDLSQGIVETDTWEEAQEAKELLAELIAHEASKQARAQEFQAQQLELQAKVQKVLPISKCGTTLEQAQKDYLKERRATLSKNTMPKQQGVLKAFLAFAGNVDLATIDSETIKDYKHMMLDRGSAPTYINDHVSVLNSFFDYCINNKIVAMDNPARGKLIRGAHRLIQALYKACFYFPGRLVCLRLRVLIGSLNFSSPVFP